ncbi:MAG: glycosyltransferase, partial [Clostridia bacterium]|nr:glycosyltransferase [Clostridia bacterium]
MIKVAEAISDMNIGGAGRLLLDRIEHSDKSRFSYTVILPKGSALVSCFKKIGVKTVEIQGCYDKSLDFKSLYRFYRAIKNISPNILNSHACINARIAGRLARVDANIYTRHCDFPIRKMYTLSVVRRFLGVAFDILNNGVIAVSDSARKNLLNLGVSDSKIKVIINGAQRLRRISNEEKSNLKRRLNIPPDSIVVSIFARLEEYKDHKTFLRAAKRLMLCDKYYFLIVGDGALADELKKYAGRLNIEPKVRFLGFVDDVSPIMNITDVNVNCSIGTETSSLALSEGM